MSLLHNSDLRVEDLHNSETFLDIYANADSCSIIRWRRLDEMTSGVHILKLGDAWAFTDK